MDGLLFDPLLESVIRCMLLLFPLSSSVVQLLLPLLLLRLHFIMCLASCFATTALAAVSGAVVSLPSPDLTSALPVAAAKYVLSASDGSACQLLNVEHFIFVCRP